MAGGDAGWSGLSGPYVSGRRTREQRHAGLLSSNSILARVASNSADMMGEGSMSTTSGVMGQSCSSEDLYRARWTWDRVAWGTHCVDFYPGNCLYRVFVKDGRVVREEPAARHGVVEDGVPDFNPMGCNKGASWSQQLYDGDRLLHPIRRVGERGSGKWEQISWDEAATTIAEAMLDAIETGGPETIVHEGTPEIATLVPTYRFFNTIGGRLPDLPPPFNAFSV